MTRLTPRLETAEASPHERLASRSAAPVAVPGNRGRGGFCRRSPLRHRQLLPRVIRTSTLVATAVLSLIAAGGAAGASAGTLNLNATLQLDFARVACPPGVPNDGRGCDHATG